MDSENFDNTLPVISQLGEARNIFCRHVSWFVFLSARMNKKLSLVFSFFLFTDTSRTGRACRRWETSIWSSTLDCRDCECRRRYYLGEESGETSDRHFSVSQSCCVARRGEDGVTCTADNPCLPSGCVIAHCREGRRASPGDDRSNLDYDTKRPTHRDPTSNTFSESDTIPVNSPRRWQVVVRR